ncbi:uncharacterized protein LOC105833460 [Monomorium pharaonis]|uniref:uncharacterized protein LOC105833460 n=1 Tax=Monomorium pharaonis TaxID=307658 RepID=UPI001746A5A5|nr:uncharacterized protein LOC105833460 [Monomorium pharaonis]
MVIRLHVNNEDLIDRDESELHFMPCKIHGDETANISSYFKPYIHSTEEEYYNSSFRGYSLQGKKVTIPAEYRGIILMENKKINTETKERNLYCTGTFSKFTYWNYDRIPSKNDTLVAALDWVDIAKVLHSPEM